MTSPLVSIIIPTFNREKQLERALNSVISQSYTNWEACIIDNNSSDGSILLINSYKDSRLKIYMIKNNGIIAASRNLGVQNSKGKYLAFLDSDDWWSSRKLEESVKFLEKEDVSVIYHDMYIINKNNQKFFFKKTKSRDLYRPIFNDLIVNGNTLITSSVVLRKDVFTKISGFNENKKYIAIEDYDAWLNLSIINANFLKISEVLGCYWLGGKNPSNPKKTIQTINSLEEKFKENIFELNLNEKTYWISYSRARAYYKIKMKDEALIEFKRTLDKKPIYSIKYKVLFMILILNVQKLF